MLDRIIYEVLDAMALHEMKVYYQPQYDTLTHKLIGGEALARWIKDDGTVIMPGKFIPILEETDIMLQFDWYIVKEVCIYMQKMLEEKVDLVPISVNFSRRHVKEADFVERLCNTVDKYGVPHELFVVEVTESILVENQERILQIIKDVRAQGFRVAIDDFGSGLSSLSFIKDITIDMLKIDRSLLSKNCEDEKERIVLESIFMFANRLKWHTVAEGVETEAQLGFMRTCNCTSIQGFLFSKPLSGDDFRKEIMQAPEAVNTEDILKIQPRASAMNLLMEAIFTRFPLVILSNLSRNSFYMMAYDNFSSTSCPSTGVYDELILHGAQTMHPEDQDLFRDTFLIANQLKAYERGDRCIKVITRQLGDDGVYRRVETTNYFVKNTSVEDVLVISLCQNIDE